MRVRAFAKINRSLRVLGVRPDGFHELRTVFQSIALHDTLTIRLVRGPFQLTCDDPGCPSDRSNLIWRAAAQAWKAAGRRGAPRDLAIHVEKRIPMRAGLGGGSSDAAATLRALSRTWRIDPAHVRTMAASIGADVPYFLEGGTVLGVERGDVLFPLLDAPRAWIVLAIPSFGVSTKEAFAWWDRSKSRRTPFVNDLEAVVAKRHPEIARLVRALNRAGAAEASMSGSGSAVFGLFQNRNAAAAAVESMSRPGRRLILTRTVDRAACQALAAK